MTPGDEEGRPATNGTASIPNTTTMGKQQESSTSPGTIAPGTDNQTRLADLQDALPREVAFHVSATTGTLAAFNAATRRGWTVTDLARWCTPDSLERLELPGAWVASRLREAAGRDPLPGAATARPGDPCGACDGSPGRWFELENGRVVHCPTCWPGSR